MVSSTGFICAYGVSGFLIVGPILDSCVDTILVALVICESVTSSLVSGVKYWLQMCIQYLFVVSSWLLLYWLHV